MAKGFVVAVVGAGEKNVLRLIRHRAQFALGAFTILLAVLLAVVAAAVAFVFAAHLTDSVVVLAVCALIAALAVAGLLNLVAARLLHRRRRFALELTAGTLLILIVLSMTTVFRPLRGSPALQGSPAGVDYWELSTGSRVAYLKVPPQGAHRRDPVVFLHGGPGGNIIEYAGRSPKNAVNGLAAAGFTVYYYDQVGGGLSERLDDVSQYTVDRQVADLEAIRRQIGAERMALVGHSWGTSLAANYLAAYPERVSKLMVIAPGPIWRPAYPGGTRTTVGDSRRYCDHPRRPGGAQPERDEDNPGNPFLTPRGLIVSGLIDVNPAAAHRLASDAEMDNALRTLPGSQGAVSFYANRMTNADREDPGRTPDIRPRLRLITTPTLIIRGQCDYLQWPIAREYRDTLPNARLLPVSQAAHNLGTLQPLLLAAIKAFLLDDAIPGVPYTGSAHPTGKALVTRQTGTD